MSFYRELFQSLCYMDVGTLDALQGSPFGTKI